MKQPMLFVISACMQDIALLVKQAESLHLQSAQVVEERQQKRWEDDQLDSGCLRQHLLQTTPVVTSGCASDNSQDAMTADKLPRIGVTAVQAAPPALYSFEL